MVAVVPTVVPVIGMSQRSGTHWLADLLALHPDCRPALRLPTDRGAGFEDLLFEHADLLASYAATTHRRWDPAHRRAIGEQELLRALGDGLRGFVVGLEAGEHPESHVVTKSPTTAGLELLPKLWPGARPLLLVRDGADVLASALASFGGSPERWIRVWRAGARAVSEFRAAHPGLGLVVRYEDLVGDLEGTLASVCTHVGLDPARLDAVAAADLAIRGSSETATGPGGLHWRPVTSPVASVGRGAGLPGELRQRLGWLAARELRAFGYEVPAPGAAGTHRARDAAWAVARIGRRVLQPQGRR